jgi:radical SAM superfamily enzyme YgiQ (UPF0313 family)
MNLKDIAEKSLPGTVKGDQERVLLVLLPFWDPQIPPLGLACLKSYLQENGFPVRAVDSNLELEFREIYDSYFNLLDRHVPGDKKGNLYNIGNQVLRNHLMAHINYDNERNYLELVNVLVEKTFYCPLPEEVLRQLNTVITGFYEKLGSYVPALVEEGAPTVLGLSLYGDTLPASLFAARLVRKRYPHIRIIAGGGIFADQLAPGAPNLETFMEKTGDYIDKVVIGEGEELLLDFVRGGLDESQRLFGLSDLNHRTLDMDSAAVPDFSDFDTEKYPYLAHYGARSCLFQCNFCSETVNWGKYRKKRPPQVVSEFRELYQNHNYQLFLMTDSLLNPIATPLAEEIIRQDVPVYWDGFLRADKPVSNPDNTLLWRRGGFYRAKLGIESGSQRVLDLMHKQTTVEGIENALTSLAYAGIKTTTFWLFGFPGETEDDFQQTLAMLERLKDLIYEADCNAFNYYLTGQANSEEWLKNNRGSYLYPRWADEILITQTWVMEGEPSRQEAYERVNRFMAHIRKLGIPNPYSLKEIHQADERWRQLHKNAVPPMVGFRNHSVSANERLQLKRVSMAQKVVEDDDGWF